MKKNVINFDLRKVQSRYGTESTWVALPKGLFNKGDVVMITPFDSDTVTITKRLPVIRR